MQERLLQELERAVIPTDADQSLAHIMYEYHNRGGFRNNLSLYCQQGIAGLTVGLCFICATCVIDWARVLTCSVDACQIVSVHAPGLFGWLFLVAYAFGGALYAVDSRSKYVMLKRVRTFYTQTIGIPDESLHIIEWTDIAKMFFQLDPSQRLVACNDIAQLTQLVMRDTNYLVMFSNSKELSCSMISLPSQYLVWYFVWSRIFYNGRLNKSMLENTQFLREQQTRAVVAAIVLSPFICAWMTMYFVIGNMRMRNIRHMEFTKRVFSRAAKMRFRHFNELPHTFEERMLRATELANKYLDAFPDPCTSIIETVIVYLFGAFIACIVLMGIVNENTMTVVHVGEYNLLWWLAFFTTSLSVARRTPVDHAVVSIKESQELLQLLSKYTARKFDADELHNLRRMLRPKYVHMLSELIESVLCPLRIWQIDIVAMSRLMRDHTIIGTPIGDVCAFARLDSLQHEDNTFSEKMRQSWHAFANNNPSWSIEEIENVETQIPIDTTQSLSFTTGIDATSGGASSLGN